MPKFMKKGLLGGLTESDSANDRENVEVRLTIKEYKDMQEKIGLYRENAARYKEMAEKHKENAAYYEEKFDVIEESIKKEADDRIDHERHKTFLKAREMERKAEHLLKELNEREKIVSDREQNLDKTLKEMSDRLAKQEELNRNLKRIARERANAQRGLTPKKEHCGYVVLMSKQYNERIDRDSIRITWHTIIQTPYDASIDFEVVAAEIMDDLVKNGIYEKLGIQTSCKKEFNGIYRSFRSKTEEGDEFEVNGVYRWRYGRNTQSDLWDINLYHTLPIIIPEEMKKSKAKKKSKSYDNNHKKVF